jgi:hypothetical protein
LAELSIQAKNDIANLDRKIAEDERRLAELREPQSDAALAKHTEKGMDGVEQSIKHLGDAVSPGELSFFRAVKAALTSSDDVIAQLEIEDKFTDYYTFPNKEEDELNREVGKLTRTRARVLWLSTVIDESLARTAASKPAIPPTATPTPQAQSVERSSEAHGRGARMDGASTGSDRGSGRNESRGSDARSEGKSGASDRSSDKGVEIRQRD